uniref:Ubiquitin carboxyl-terminal hydrolase n=1 Tax=Caenorhabditis tropicalis TaxID=1561998 RepID=A0A1I7TNS7_9PELO
MTNAGNWCSIESDPGVFTEMLHRPVYGLIFLFKYRQGEEATGTPSEQPGIFFAQQVIQNACATQALINLIMNIEDPDVKIGKVLGRFQRPAFTQMRSRTVGELLSNNLKIRTVHNSFSRQTLFEIDVKGGAPEDNYHFVTYVPIGGKVFELDGLREHPLEVATVEAGGDWVEAVRPIIQQRIFSKVGDVMPSTLMALVPNRKKQYQEMLESLLQANDNNKNNELYEQIADINKAIEEEDRKMATYRKENARRRHNVFKPVRFTPYYGNKLIGILGYDEFVVVPATAVPKKLAKAVVAVIKLSPTEFGCRVADDVANAETHAWNCAQGVLREERVPWIDRKEWDERGESCKLYKCFGTNASSAKCSRSEEAEIAEMNEWRVLLGALNSLASIGRREHKDVIIDEKCMQKWHGEFDIKFDLNENEKLVAFLMKEESTVECLDVEGKSVLTLKTPSNRNIHEIASSILYAHRISVVAMYYLVESEYVVASRLLSEYIGYPLIAKALRVACAQLWDKEIEEDEVTENKDEEDETEEDEEEGFKGEEGETEEDGEKDKYD